MAVRSAQTPAPVSISFVLEYNFELTVGSILDITSSDYDIVCEQQ